MAENKSPEESEPGKSSAKQEGGQEGAQSAPRVDLGARLRASGKMPDDVDKPKVGPLPTGPKYRNLTDEEVADLASRLELESETSKPGSSEEEALAKLFEKEATHVQAEEKLARFQNDEIAKQFKLEQKRARAEAKLAELRLKASAAAESGSAPRALELDADVEPASAPDQLDADFEPSSAATNQAVPVTDAQLDVEAAVGESDHSVAQTEVEAVDAEPDSSMVAPTDGKGAGAEPDSSLAQSDQEIAGAEPAEPALSADQRIESVTTEPVRAPGFSSRHDLNAPKAAKVSGEFPRSSATAETKESPPSSTAPDSVRADSVRASSTPPDSVPSDSVPPDSVPPGDLARNDTVLRMPSKAVRRKPQHTGTHKSIDFPGSLQQEQKKIGSMQTNLERAQILFSLVLSFIINNAFLVGGITTGIISGALLLTNYALISSRSSYLAGLEHFNKHENFEAIKSLNKAIFFNRYYLNAYIYRGKAYSGTNNSKRAFDDFSEALRLAPANAEALLAHAAVAVKFDLGPTAVDDLAKVERESPDLLTHKPDDLINFSQAYLLVGNDKLAMAEINECLRHYSSNANVLVQRAKCFQAMKNYQGALIDCKNAVKNDPGNAVAQAELGNTYELLNDYVHDKPALDRAIELDPNLAKAHAYLALHFLRSYQFAPAVSESNQAATLDGSAKMYYAHADLLTKCGDFKSALKVYNKATSLADFKPTGHFYVERAGVEALLSKYDAALQDVSEATRVEPKNTLRYMIKRADILAASKNYKQAREELDKVLAQDPKNAEALFKHGWYSEMGDNKITAMDDYFKAIKVAPRNPQAYLRRGISYFGSKQYDSAAADFRQALALDPTLIEAKEKLRTCISDSKQLAATTPAKIVQQELTKAQLHEIATLSSGELLQKGYQALQGQRIQYALAALTRSVRENPNDKTARNYLFHALVVSGQADLATTQVLALEKIGDLKVEDEIGFVTALRQAGSNEQARKLVDHLIERFATDSAALAVIAQNCSTWDYYDKAKEACDKALLITSDISRATNLKDLRDVAVKKLAQRTLQPAQMSIYKPGAGEASAPP